MSVTLLDAPYKPLGRIALAKGKRYLLTNVTAWRWKDDSCLVGQEISRFETSQQDTMRGSTPAYNENV